MALELKQGLRLAQQLVVTPQLQQAIKLLQLSRLELATLIQKELLENPVLEESDGNPDEDTDEKKSAAETHEEAKDADRGHDHTADEVGTADGKMNEPADFDWSNYVESFNAPEYSTERDRGSDETPVYENVTSLTESLHDHLLWQLHLSAMNERQQKIGTEIIGNINDDGYLRSSVEEIASGTGVELEEAKEVLARIQEFDPAGVAARDVKECLTLQSKLLGEDGRLIAAIVDDCLPELERHDPAAIAKKKSLPLEKVKYLVHMISELDPKPGRAFNQETPQYITPDVYVQKVGDEYVVTLNEDGMPKLKVSEFYRKTLMRGSSAGDQTKEYVQDRLRSAMWLIKSIHQRQRTMFRVSTSIVKFQRDFFEKGMGHLRPLVLRDVAEDIEMHESTISRVTANKFMHTPRGIFELKFFFNSGVHQLEGGGIASEVVKLLIKKLIAEEDAKNPLSDQEISDKLQAKNINMARRTVAKYREALGVLPSSKRKRKDRSL